MRVFVDTAWNSKKHTCYDPIKDAFFEVDSLVELKDYQEMYLDSSIFPNMWQQLREIINEGEKVYHFTRPWKWKEIRERFKDELKNKIGRVSKSDRGDAYLIYKVYELSLMKRNTHRYFRQLTIIDVELRPLLMKEQIIYKNLDRIRKMREIGIDVSSDVEEYEKKLENVRREIVEKATEVIPGFIEVAEALGLSREDVNGLTGLAGLLTYLRFYLGFKSIDKSINYLGLFKAKSSKGNMKKKCNRKAVRYCNLLALSILWKNGQKHPPTLKDLRTILKQLINLLRQTGSAMAGGGG